MKADYSEVRIAQISNDNKLAVTCVVLSEFKFPVPVIIKCSKTLKVGQKLRLKKGIKVGERKTQTGGRYFVFEKGEENFKVLPDVYTTTIRYISTSEKYVGISVYIVGKSAPVLAFLPRPVNSQKGDEITVSTSLNVYPVTKSDKSTFYFFKEGWCNFIIHGRIRSPYSSNQEWDNDEQGREDYYEELGNSICEYCGEYHCDCQRYLDEQYDDLRN